MAGLSVITRTSHGMAMPATRVPVRLSANEPRTP